MGSSFAAELEAASGFRAVLAMIAEQARHFTHADGSAIRLRSGNILQAAARSGLPFTLDARFAAQFSNSSGPLRLDHLQSNDFEIEDSRQRTPPEELAHPANASLSKNVSAILVPVSYGQRVAGVLEVFYEGDRCPADTPSFEHTQILQMMSDWIASALNDAAAAPATASMGVSKDQLQENSASRTIPVAPPEEIIEPFPTVSIFASEPSGSTSMFHFQHKFRWAAALAFFLVGLNVALVLHRNNDAYQRELLTAQTGQINSSESISALETAVNARPTDPNAHYNLAVTLYRASRFRQAAPEFREALRLSPDYSNARSGLGLCLIQLRNYDDAIAEFYQAAAANSGDSDSHYYLGVLLESRAMPKSAIAEYKKALEINPEHTAAHLGLAEANWSVGERSRSKPSANTYYDTAWKEVHGTQTLGGRVDSVFMAALRQRMPDPER